MMSTWSFEQKKNTVLHSHSFKSFKIHVLEFRFLSKNFAFSFFYFLLNEMISNWLNVVDVVIFIWIVRKTKQNEEME